MTYGAIGAIVLMVLGVGGWTFHQATQNSIVATNSQPAGAASLVGASPSAAPTIVPSIAPAQSQPLTADTTGEYCPLAHVGDNACWHGSFVNTGPPIGTLTMIFVSGGPYTDWYATHSGEALSGFYTTAGCESDRVRSQITCGSVGAGGQVTVYISGDATTRGHFYYAVKFADISSGTPVYVNQHPDGTHDVVSWQELVT